MMNAFSMDLDIDAIFGELTKPSVKRIIIIIIKFGFEFRCYVKHGTYFVA